MNSKPFFWNLIFGGLVICLFAFAGCRPDTSTPKWDVETVTPLINSRLEVSDIIPDTSLTVANDGLLSLVYRSKLADFNLDQINDQLSSEFFNTVKLQTIDLGTRVISNDLSLGQMANSAGVPGLFIIQNNGNNAVIPGFNGLGPETFPADATQFFESITLNDGWMVVRIQNGWPIELTNVDYRLENQVSGTILIQSNIPSIMPGAVHLDSVQLNNGITIEGKINAVLQNLDTPGSNGAPVLIDTTDAINISITIKDLVPQSATAIFPAQNLVDETTYESFESSKGQFRLMNIRSGTAYMDATSTIDGAITFEYLVPNATKGSQVLSFKEILPPAPYMGSSQKYAEIDIVDYDLLLTGQPGDVGLYNMFYVTVLGRIDSTGQLINLSLDDSVYLRTGLVDVTFARAYGYLGEDTIQSTETTTVDVFNDFLDGAFDFDDVIVTIDIENYIGAPLDVRVNNVNSSNDDGVSKGLTWTQMASTHSIPPAQENQPGTKPTPGMLSLGLDKNNSNLDEVLEIKPSSMAIDLTGYINENTTTPDYNQFLYTDYGISAFMSVEVPFHLSASGINLRDTSIFVYTDLDPGNRLQGGELKVLGDNHFPMEGKVDLLLFGADSAFLGRLPSTDVIEAGKVNSDGRVIESTQSQASYVLDSEAVKWIKATTMIVFDVHLNTANLPEKVKFYHDNFLDLKLTGDLTLRTGQ